MFVLKYTYVLDACSSFEGNEFLVGMVVDNWEHNADRRSRSPDTGILDNC